MQFCVDPNKLPKISVFFYSKRVKMFHNKKKGPTRHRPIAYQILNNSFCVMSQSGVADDGVTVTSVDRPEGVHRNTRSRTIARNQGQ